MVHKKKTVNPLSLYKDSSNPLMHHDLSNLGLQNLLQIIPMEHTLSVIFEINNHVVAFFYLSPSGLSYEDTYNTLKYADRAMNITCKVVKNELSVDMHVSRYAKIVEELRIEVTQIPKPT